MYEKVLREKSKKIIELLCEDDRTLTELAKKIEVSKPTLQQKYMGDLIGMGIVDKRIRKNSKGRESIYSLKPFTLHISTIPDKRFLIAFSSNLELDREHFLLNQVSNKRFREPLKELLVELEDLNIDISNMILFGSVAKGSGTEKSDIDLLFLARKWEDRKKEIVLDVVSSVSIDFSNPVRPLFMTMGSFIGKKGRLISEINDHGIILYESRNGDGAIWSQMKRYRNISI